MNNLTWTCHICGEERPDDKIAVYKHERVMANGVSFTENVRYCIDKPKCADEATRFHFFPA